MATSFNLRKGLNRKQWELVNPAPVATSTGACIISSNNYRNQQLYLSSGASAYIYLPEEDAYVSLPNPSLGGAFGNGTCGAASCIGPTGTATSGSATTLVTNLNLQRDLRGYKIHITGGAGAGQIVDIESNTIGSNATITATFSTPVNNTSTFRLFTPRWYVLNGGTQSASSFRVYCFALNTWSSLSVTNLFASSSGDTRLIATPSRVGGEFISFATGTATGGTANTISNTAKNWSTNQFTNFQIRITGGTGAGQVRTISSNTATAITVASNWATTPDATSTYAIEGNDDYLYVTGNSSTTTYRYSISGNTWSTLAARPASTGAGIGAHWVYDTNDTTWKNENAIINGRRIYSFSGNSGAVLHYYDIPSNTWATVTYAPAIEGFSTGTKYVYNGNFIYIQINATGRWVRYNVVTSEQYGWHVMVFTQGTAIIGDTAFDYTYVDGTTKITFIYMLLNSSSAMMRTIII